MDAYVDWIVKKQKSFIEHLAAFSIVIACFVLACFILTQFSRYLGFISIFIAIGAIYLAYRLVMRTNIEYEYIFTNGSFDIDIIYAKSTRKRIFSAECKDFEILAKLSNQKSNEQTDKTLRNIHAESSQNSSGVYYFILPYEGRRTVVYFEPDVRLLDCFRKFIPGKLKE